MAITPLERGRQPRTPVEVARGTSAFVPLARSVRKVAVHTAAVGVLLEPVAQPWPLTQQRFVGDLDRRGAHRQQPAVGQERKDAGEIVTARAFELRQGDAPANHRAAAALSGEPEQDHSRDGLLRRVELAERLLRQARHRSAHAAGALVRRKQEVTPVAPLPQLEQRRGQERQGPGFVLDVRDKSIHQLGFDDETGALCGPLDRAAQLLAPHRSDEHVVGSERRRQRRICGTAGIEVGPHCEHDKPACVARPAHERVDERRALGLVAACGEDLLELVDRQHDLIGGGHLETRAAQLVHRMLARTEHQLRPRVDTRQDSAGQRRQQPRPHE